MNDRVLRFIREEQLIRPGDHIVCAVSGGADSMALLLFFLTHREALSVTLEAAHFNHLLRGAEADGDEEYVRTFCREHGIPFTAGRGDVNAFAKESGQTPEEAARTLRYRFLESRPGLIATAHTADDNAETVLMNLTRGAGMHGLCGIAPKQGRVIRPMLAVTHEAAKAYLTQLHTDWREDATNAEDFCRRNRIRHHVVPALTEENPALAATVLRTCRQLREEDRFLDSVAEELLSRARCSFGYRCAVLLEQGPVPAARALRLLFSCDSAHTDALLSMLKKGNGAVSLPGSRTAACSCGILLEAVPARCVVSFSCHLAPGETVPLPGTGLTAALSRLEAVPEVLPEGSLLLREIPGGVTIRNRMQGDSLLCSGGHRSLKRLMIDRKIPAPLRDTLPVVCDGDRAAAVFLLGTGRDYLPEQGKPAYLITFTGAEALKIETQTTMKEVYDCESGY